MEYDYVVFEAGNDYQPGTEPLAILDSYSDLANVDPRFLWYEVVVSFRRAEANTPGELPRRLYEKGRVIQRGRVHGVAELRV